SGLVHERGGQVLDIELGVALVARLLLRGDERLLRLLGQLIWIDHFVTCLTGSACRPSLHACSISRLRLETRSRLVVSLLASESLVARPNSKQVTAHVVPAARFGDFARKLALFLAELGRHHDLHGAVEIPVAAARPWHPLPGEANSAPVLCFRWDAKRHPALKRGHGNFAAKHGFVHRDGRSTRRSSPSRVKKGCGFTRTRRYASPGGPPPTPGLPWPARRMRWPSFTPGGIFTVSRLAGWPFSREIWITCSDPLYASGRVISTS